jgi:hypothetical protein
MFKLNTPSLVAEHLVYTLVQQQPVANLLHPSQTVDLAPAQPPPRPSPRLPVAPSGVLLACSTSLALHTYDNTLGDTPPDTLGLTILIPRERGCMTNPGHKHNKSPYS